jgi:RHS repeat-associated protein
MTENMPNPFRYSGELWGSKTELQYLRARWYDPSIGRFITQDTYEGDISNPLSLNLYAYAQNNPERFIDPSGHMVQEPTVHHGEGFGKMTPEDYVFLHSFLRKYARTAAERTELWLTFIYPTINKEAFGEAFLDQASIIGGINYAGYVGLRKGPMCNCFTAGTIVLTDEGEKPIEEIEVGDKVLAKDDETGEMAYKEVEWLFQRDVEETYNITVGGEVITTTDEHPFWIVGKGWVESKNLVVGDVLTTSDGKELAIEKIEVKKEHRTVYNFKVKDFHTYFVSSLGIWTHNSCGYKANDKTPGGLIFTEHGAQRANERGFTAQVIDSIVQNNKRNRVSKVDSLGRKTWNIWTNVEIRLF